ncbi:MAG: hypothetical protein KME23_02785 [Goleter apudmare HA4340-LM2]|jgi:hypothetical protein|nr:hypothetical protein [Goleter apudmare HA4340-LM2]
MDNLVLVLAIFFLILLFLNLFMPQKYSNNWRLSRIEQKLDRLMQQLDIEYVDSMSENIEQHLRRGNTIEAIRAFRQMNPGISLKEALDAVKSIEKNMRQA